MNTQTDRELATLQKSLPTSYYISDDVYRRIDAGKIADCLRCDFRKAEREC
jgi:hypothetical protein